MGGRSLGLFLSREPVRTVRTGTCDCCTAQRQVVTGFVYDDENTLGAYVASCYPHNGEVWIDVILGSWGGDTNDDRVTFGCRVGPVDGQPTPGCSLVPAASVGPDSPVYGQKLDREMALRHPWLPRFWDIVDLILTADPTVQPHVYGTSGAS
jgi:hypothetical protein